MIARGDHLAAAPNSFPLAGTNCLPLVSTAGTVNSTVYFCGITNGTCTLNVVNRVILANGSVVIKDEAMEWVSASAVQCKVGQGPEGSRQGDVTTRTQSGNEKRDASLCKCIESCFETVIIDPDTNMIVIQAMLFLAIICAHFCACDRLIEIWSAKKRINLRRTIKLFSLLGLASNITAAGAQSFTTKAIGQSNPVAGASNTITVTLVSDTALAAADGSTVTVSGLIGGVASSPVTLIDAGNGGETIFSDGTTQGTGAWSSGTLTLTLHNGESVVASTTYTFRFQITNPESATASPTINIAASGTATIASAAMTKPGTELYGVANGADPLTVVVPIFSLKSIQQSNIMAGVPNTLRVSLTANFNLPTGSKVTITGLTGSQTADTGNLAVSSTSNLLGTTGAWTQASGQLVLTAANGGTASATACVVSFVLYNPDVAQASPAVSVVAAIKDGSSNSVGSIAPVAMAKPGTALYGLANGADPMTVITHAISVSTSSNAGAVRVSVNMIKSLTIAGTSTGLFSETGTARIQYTTCEATIWASDSNAVCKVPSGMFSTLKAIVTVGENAVPASANEAVSYDQLGMNLMSQTR
jgi:hypothetical protein